MEIIVDPQRCNQDDLCVKICPGELIQRSGDQEFPKMRSELAEDCMSCGHCVAICPRGALTHSKVDLTNSPKVNRKLKLNEEHVQHFMRSRRSIRHYKNQPVEKETIESLIRLASYAPTGCNTQLVEWTVFTEPTYLKKLAALCIQGLEYAVSENPQGDYLTIGYEREIIKAWKAQKDQVLWDAPTLLIASSPQNTPCENIDLTIALSYLDLAAPTYGLGTCWTGTFSDMIGFWKPLAEALSLPGNHTYHYAMTLGYPKYRFTRMPERKSPKITWHSE